MVDVSRATISRELLFGAELAIMHDEGIPATFTAVVKRLEADGVSKKTCSTAMDMLMDQGQLTMRWTTFDGRHCKVMELVPAAKPFFDGIAKRLQVGAT